MNSGRKIKLTRDFFLQDASLVAPGLLGKMLVYNTGRNILAGKVVETEAYLGRKDKASHSYKGKITPRNKILYQEGGRVYLYAIYGLYLCFNVVCNLRNIPQAVFIRALEPIEGIDIMRKNSPKVRTSIMLTNGPCRWTRSFGIKKELYGEKGYKDSLYFLDPKTKPQIVKAKRIGIDYAGVAVNWKLRFYIKGHPFVSRK